MQAGADAGIRGAEGAAPCRKHCLMRSAGSCVLTQGCTGRTGIGACLERLRRVRPERLGKQAVCFCEPRMGLRILALTEVCGAVRLGGMRAGQLLFVLRHAGPRLPAAHD
jgi:hypothetical protein